MKEGLLRPEIPVMKDTATENAETIAPPTQ